LSSASNSLGLHLILGIHGTSLTAAERVLFRRLQPAGILLFSRNFAHDKRYSNWTETLKALLDEVREATGRDRLLISIDHEGGHVLRVPAPLTKFPYAVQYSLQAEAVGAAMARELASIGINVSWAPVADIHSNHLNPVIGPRAFGSSASDVASLAVQYLHGLQRHGVLGCAKHFPGHGDTSVDSHFDLPVQNASLSEIRNRELVPFKALFDVEVPLLMTAHILYSAIDSDNPVTLSKRFLKQLLREELKFKGVVVSDDLEMKAVRDRFLQPGILADAFDAGNDMFIIARTPSAPSDLTLHVEREFKVSLEKGRLTADSLLAPRTRVENLLVRLEQHKVTTLSRDVLNQHAALAIDSAW
jgi:beta-N-acetylhexosaminidase